MLGFLECIGNERVRPVLQKYRLLPLEPTQWYPLQVWADVMRELSGSTMDLVSIGMKMMDVAPWPSGFEKLPFIEILQHINLAYQANHQGDVGGYLVEVVDEHHAIIDVQVPYPDDLVYGAYWQICKKFLPAGTYFTVHFDDAAPLRKEGGQVTKIHLTWK